ncbi:MAG: hypothetical protein IJC39_00625 [Firmicutes bacterium]|nr:hypothetical protein [Bacillota bacterium]
MKKFRFLASCLIITAALSLCGCGEKDSRHEEHSEIGRAQDGDTSNHLTGTTSAADNTIRNSDGSVNSGHLNRINGQNSTGNLSRLLRDGTGAGGTGFYADYLRDGIIRSNSGGGDRILDDLQNRTSSGGLYYTPNGTFYDYQSNPNTTFYNTPYNASSIMPELNGE